MSRAESTAICTIVFLEKKDIEARLFDHAVSMAVDNNAQRLTSIEFFLGFASGIKTKLLIMQGADNTGAIIKNFLAEIGIDAEIDIADVGRFWGSINGGWQGLLLGPYAVNPEFCVAWLHHFGPEPLMKFASMAKSKEYIDLCNKLVVAPDIASMRKATQEMVTQAGLDVMFIPLTLNMGASVYATNLHTGYYLDLDWTYWSIWDDWMEKAK